MYQDTLQLTVVELSNNHNLLQQQLVTYKWEHIWNDIQDYLSNLATIESAVIYANQKLDIDLVPINLLKRDAELLKQCNNNYGDFIQTAITRLNNNNERLRQEVVDKIFQHYKNYKAIKDLASYGGRIWTENEFQPCSQPIPLRNNIRKLESALLVQIIKLWKAYKIIVLPTNKLSQLNVHFNSAHWVSDKQKPLGRFIVDCTNGNDKQVVNTLYNLEQAKAFYGQMKLPSIKDVVFIIRKLVDTSTNKKENIYLWKLDISGAFNQFTMGVESTKFLAVQISESISIVYIVGLFGLNSAPVMYTVISDAIQWQMTNSNINSSTYVDDTLGVSIDLQTASNDFNKAKCIIKDILGPSSIDDKSDKIIPPSKRLDHIGWTIDIEKWCILPNTKGIYKLLYYSHIGTTININSPAGTRTFEILASLASRYNIVFKGLSPFIRSLYILSYHHTNSDTDITLGRISAFMWKMAAISAYHNMDNITMSIDDLFDEFNNNVLYVKTDASPTGIGIIIRDSNYQILHVCSYILPYHMIESKYQNLRELHGIVLCLLIIIKYKHNKSKLIWYGDNMSAIAWVKKNVAKSSAAFATFAVYSWLLTFANVFIQPQHIPGISMGDVDKLSRQIPTEQSYDGYLISNEIQTDQLINKIIDISKPLQDENDSVNNCVCFEFIFHIYTLVKEFINMYV